MDIWKTLAGAATALGATVGSSRAQDLQLLVDHAAARMVVIPEARDTLLVSVQHGPSRLPPLQVRQEGRRVMVDGGLGRSFGGPGNPRCMGGLQLRGVFNARARNDRVVEVGGVGRIPYADLPVITVHAPTGLRVAAGPAVYGEVGRSDRLTLDLAGCGDWTVADVRGRLAADLSGSGDLRSGAVGELAARLAGSGDLGVGPVAGHAEAQVAGSGDVEIGSVGQGLRAQVSGSGDVRAARVNGPIEASISASGDVRVHGGHASQVSARVVGSGDFVFDGVAESVSAAVAGSGDIHVARALGPVDKHVVGSGEVSVGR